MNRRSFLASTLLCAASAGLPANAASPDWPSRPANLPATPPPTKLAPWLDSLLRDAARAPSSHNSQPWTLTLVSILLRQAGVGAVVPFALASTAAK